MHGILILSFIYFVSTEEAIYANDDDNDTSIKPTVFEKFCPFKQIPRCDPQYPYRKLDGSCNNLNVPWLGQSEKPFKRWLDADYSDCNFY